MKVGTIRSPRHYDDGAENTIEATLMRYGRPSHCADQRACSARSGYGIICHSIVALFTDGTLERTPMPTRNVVLTKRQEELIETLVESGRYQNASEVLRDGLRLVEQREAEDATKLEALREAARVGVAALDRGEFKEFENIEDLQAYLNDLSEKVISRTAE
jgi:antitoxin ParD1/3/4